MELALCIRHILTDHRTLKQYERGENVEWEDIKRRLLLSERANNPVIPDHFYEDAFKYELKLDELKAKAKDENLASFIPKGLTRLAEIFITTHNGRGEVRYVQTGLFEQWQNLLTLCPPMILIAAHLSKESSKIDACFIDKYITCNVKNTSLLHPYVETIEGIDGFNDLHIHLNGSTETDVLWQYFLNNPEVIQKDFKSALKQGLVKEQTEQEQYFDDIKQLHSLLRKARALRYYMIRNFLTSPPPTLEFPYPNSDTQTDNCYQQTTKGVHPLKSVIAVLDDKYNDNELECLMYVKILKKLQETETSPLLAKAFHHYLLILGAVNSFVIQQKHQNGFRQFQKITKNRFRDGIETQFKQRFNQLSGNNNNNNSNFDTLEGRISPKNTPEKIHKILQKIGTGWSETHHRGKSLNLVFHFIKESQHKDDSFRHQNLRAKLWQQSNAISSIINDELLFRDDLTKRLKIVGIDAASSEFDAPPEVFAPSYRFLRQNGVCNFTFHAGEDFSHIVSGLRAIFEAVHFLDLKSNDKTKSRIGHATALGVSPSLWKERIGEKIYISQGEWLDNLLFCYHFRIETKKIKAEIEKLCTEIYGRNYDIRDLICAWLYRKWEPSIILNNTGSPKNYNDLELSKTPKIGSPIVIELLQTYHDQSSINKYDVINKIDTSILSIKNIKSLQKRLTRQLNKAKIVRETLPTSNLRIGIYKSYKEHHFIKWFKNRTNKKLIVVGSDDTGIFATNIKNEYFHISESMNRKDAIQFLTDNAKKHLFKN